MPGIVGFHGQIAAYQRGRVIGDGAEQRHGGIGVGHGEKRLDGLFTRMVAIHECGIAFRDVSRVPQHGCAQIDRGGRRIDRAVEALLHEQRQTSAVIDMRVREHYRIDGSRGERHFPVLLFSFFTASLKHTAIEKNRSAARFQFVLRSCDAASSAVKCEFHPWTAYTGGLVADRRTLRIEG